MTPIWFKVMDGSAQLLLYIQAGEKITQIAGIHGGALKVRVAAAAIDGKANIALCAFIAKTLDIPVTSVQIASGEKSRRKILRIAPLDDETIQKLEQMGI